MKYLNSKIQVRIEKKLIALDSLRPLPPSAIFKLRDQFALEMTYNSNAIEGNSLTLKETNLVINEGITIKGKPLKDHLEVTNHQEALEYLYDLVKKGKNRSVSEILIRSINQIVMQNIDKEWAGRYRNSPVIIGGADHKPPEAFNVPRLMHELISWISKNKKKVSPVEMAAIVHHKLVHIHPFFDGNGRTSRLVMNIILLQAGFPLTVILKNDRKKYYRTLELADKGNYIPFVNFIAQSVERSLDIYLKTLTPSKKNEEKNISLAQLAKNSKFSEKYLNLLARGGKLEAHKEGRNWVTTKEALQRYLSNRDRIRE